jgi:hypothetical protein
MLKKVFVLEQFGKPHDWSEKYLHHLLKLEEFGWYWKIVTPNKYASRGNVEIIPMELTDFCGLVLKYCGTPCPAVLNDKNVPSKLLSDYYPAWGWIFQDICKDADFVGTANWDVVYGRIDRYVPDSLLGDCDIYSDDEDRVNSVFTLYRNDPVVLNLFRQMPGWEHVFTRADFFGWDEFQFGPWISGMGKRGEIRFKYPRYFAQHSYDRLIQHQPEPRLYLEKDGGLIEWYADPVKPHVLMPKGHFGREIMYFHFNTTKKWPL